MCQSGVSTMSQFAPESRCPAGHPSGQLLDTMNTHLHGVTTGHFYTALYAIM